MNTLKNNYLTKTRLFALACLTVAMASCASPEERSARKSDTLGTAPRPEAAPVDSPLVDSVTNANNTAPDPAKPDPSVAAPATTATTPVTAEKKPEATKAEPAKAPAATKKMPGEALLAKSDCLACHNAKIKIVGPAYKDVAAKYTASDTDMLVNKIINGGAGNWGDIPMSPHAALSKADAKLMVQYILSLK